MTRLEIAIDQVTRTLFSVASSDELKAYEAKLHQLQEDPERHNLKIDLLRTAINCILDARGDSSEIKMDLAIPDWRKVARRVKK